MATKEQARGVTTRAAPGGESICTERQPDVYGGGALTHTGLC